jgi:ABC-type transport system involved in multi-copper enzyme maturation permease subunit
VGGVVTLLFGPLAGPECRRAVARGWVILVRALVALAPMSVALFAVWFWWLSLQFDSNFRPHDLMIGSLATIEGMLITIALILCPATLAGSLAGDRQRGNLGLLLTTRVSSREIVTGRLSGKLCQLSMILLAGLPALVLMSALDDISGTTFLAAIGLPVAVAFGSAGVALAASVTMRRGIVAMVAVYLFLVLLLLGPRLASSISTMTTLPLEVSEWLALTNPFQSMFWLLFEDSLLSAVITSGFWLAIGIVGTSVAAWRLKRACVRELGGDTVRGRSLRRGWVPPLDEERPMLWKELFIERAGSLGRFGWALGWLLFLWLAGASTLLGGIASWSVWIHPDAKAQDWAVSLLDWWIVGPSGLCSMLIQWTVGLRAAVAISSERERGTWDALLTSPLQGREIVRGKLWGSLYALRWLFGAAFWAWTIAAVWGTMSWGNYLNLVARTVVSSAFLAAAGVRISLVSPSTTNSMAIIIGVWAGAWAGLSLAAVLLILTVMAVGIMLFLLAAQVGWADMASPPTIPITFDTAYVLIQFVLYLLATISIVVESRLRFDRLAGRRAGGAIAVKVDDLIHGEPLMHAPIASSNEIQKGPRSVGDLGRQAEALHRDKAEADPD